MRHCTLRLGLSAVLAAGLALTATGLGQDKDKPPPPEGDRPAAPIIKSDPRRFFKAPETAPEFWRALRYEIAIGKYDIAAEYLRGFLGRNPTDEELLQIEAKEGISAFLQLLTIPRWSDDKKVDAEARKNAAELVARVNVVVRKQLGDPKRIAKFVANLKATEEERTYAIGELRKAGALAVPALVAELIRTVNDADEHHAVLSALPYLADDAHPALIAALDVDNPTIRAELIDVLVEKSETRAVPHLWYLSAAKAMAGTVRAKATEALKRFLPRQSGKLPEAHVALTDEARRYHQHKVPFGDSQRVTVWQWDGKQLTSEIVPVSKAEEYVGLRFARQALALKPDHEPAQQVFLALAVEKGFERAGMDQPLSKGAPEVKELLGSASGPLLTAVLEQALADRRTAVVLGTVRALGDRAEVAALKSADRGTPALIRALYYPDRRVQMAAADAVLRIPSTPSPQVSTRVVEILARAVAAEPEANAKPRARLLVAFATEDASQAVGQAAQKAGFDAVRVHSGREALLRLNEASDIDMLVVDAGLPGYGLESLLGQLRADVNAGLLPLLLVAPTGREPVLRDLVERFRQETRRLEDSKLRDRAQDLRSHEEDLKRLRQTYANENERLREAYERFTEGRPNVWIAADSQVRDADRLKAEVQERLKETKVPPLTEAERKAYAAEAILWLARLGRGEIAGYDIQPAENAIVQALRSDELAAPAAEAAARLANPRAQRELAMVLLDNKRPAPLRAKAAEELVVSLQLRGSSLLSPHLDGLKSLYETTSEAQLKPLVAQVFGSLRPSAAETGQRLQRYVPPLRTAPPPEEGKPKEPAPEKEKEKEGK